MKKVRFLFLILALVLVVGMTTGLIVRKQTGGQTVMQHSAQAPDSSTSATTDDDEPAAAEPDPTVFKIPVLIRQGLSQYFTVIENDVEVDPFDVFEYSPSLFEEESKSDGSSYSETYVRYLVDPTCSSIVFDHTRAHNPWYAILSIDVNFDYSSCFHWYVEDDDLSSSGIFYLSASLFFLIY